MGTPPRRSAGLVRVFPGRRASLARCLARIVSTLSIKNIRHTPPYRCTVDIGLSESGDHVVSRNKAINWRSCSPLTIYKAGGKPGWHSRVPSLSWAHFQSHLVSSKIPASLARYCSDCRSCDKTGISLGSAGLLAACTGWVAIFHP